MSVYLYIPNIIGYVRIICAMIFCYAGSTNPILSAFTYSIS